VHGTRFGDGICVNGLENIISLKEKAADACWQLLERVAVAKFTFEKS
jgi:hypothetical protein